MRKTHISADSLRHIFEGGRTPSAKQSQGSAHNTDLDDGTGGGRKVNSVSSQCVLNAAHMELCDMLLRSQETGVMTASHARERQAVALWSQSLFLDVRLEERYQRDRIMSERRELLEAFRLMLLVLQPIETRARATVRRMQGSASEPPSSPRMSGQAARSPSQALRHGAKHGMLSPAGGGLEAVELRQEVERLQDRILSLEKQLATKMKLDWLIQPAQQQPSRLNTVLGRGSLAEGAPATTHAEVIATVVALEQHERASLAEQEAHGSTAILCSHQMFLAEERALASRRFLIHTPYDAYRPKVPLQHSLAPEEFLKRWVLAETFKHYEDLLTMVQTWENTARVAIEDEALQWTPLLKGVVFEPHFRSRCSLLESELTALRHEKILHDRDIAVLAGRAKVQMLDAAEEHSRQMLVYFEREDRERIRQVASSLAELKDTAKRARFLEVDRDRQALRHQQELLHMHRYLTGAVSAIPGSQANRLDTENRFDQYVNDAFLRGEAAGYGSVTGIAALIGGPTGTVPTAGRRAGTTTTQSTVSTPRLDEAITTTSSGYVEQVYARRRKPLRDESDALAGVTTVSTPRRPMVPHPPATKGPVDHVSAYWAGF